MGLVSYAVGTSALSAVNTVTRTTEKLRSRIIPYSIRRCFKVEL